MLDTVVPGHDGGQLPADQRQWLDDLAGESTVPVLVFGHHYVANLDRLRRRATCRSGSTATDSEALVEVFARRERDRRLLRRSHAPQPRPALRARRRGCPCCEVACTKDYPGAWAEYRVYEGGYTQVVRRVTDPAAFAWAEKTRGLYAGFYRDYALGPLDWRCFTQAF